MNFAERSFSVLVLHFMLFGQFSLVLDALDCYQIVILSRKLSYLVHSLALIVTKILVLWGS